MSDILFTVVGQYREFELARESHYEFIRKLKASGPDVNVHVSYVLWDTSFAQMLGMKCFMVDGITPESVDYLDIDVITESLTINVIPESRAVIANRHHFNLGEHTDEFSFVAFLNERALKIMQDIEYRNGIKFDAVILTRPDLFILSAPCPIFNVDSISPNSVYYESAGRTTLAMNSFGLSKPTQVTIYKDMITIFGRQAFEAYGLMYRYLVAGATTGPLNKMVRVGSHRWPKLFLDQFGITSVDIESIMPEVKHVVARPNVLCYSSDNTDLTKWDSDTSEHTKFRILTTISNAWNDLYVRNTVMSDSDRALSFKSKQNELKCIMKLLNAKYEVQ